MLPMLTETISKWAKSCKTGDGEDFLEGHNAAMNIFDVYHLLHTLRLSGTFVVEIGKNAGFHNTSKML